LHNTNLLYAIAPENINNRNLRTTFFYNQVSRSNLVTTSDKFDFKVNGEYDFAVGGKYTKGDGENKFAAADMIETGDVNTIPIWLFGFLY
jgi:hypothetical protein